MLTRNLLPACAAGLLLLSCRTHANGNKIQKGQDSQTRQHGYSSLTLHSPFAYQWARMYENPGLEKAWSLVDEDTKAELEALLFDRRSRVVNASSTASSSLSQTTQQSASTLSTQTSAIFTGTTASSQAISSASSTKTSEEQRQEKIEKEIERLKKQIEDMERKQANGTSWRNETLRQDCGFGELTSKTWRESGASAALKEELKLWREKHDGQAFHAHMFKTYAPGLARSSGHCNGRGFCSVRLVLSCLL